MGSKYLLRRCLVFFVFVSEVLIVGFLSVMLLLVVKRHQRPWTAVIGSFWRDGQGESMTGGDASPKYQEYLDVFRDPPKHK